MEGTSYRLVCPFMNDDPLFALGVEFGMLHARMSGKARRIDDCFCRANQERILLLANRLGWHVRKVRRVDKCWFRCVMVRGEPRSEPERAG